MSKHKIIFYKAILIVFSITFIPWYVYVQMHNPDGSWFDVLVKIFFVYLMIEVFKKFYFRKFGENHVAEYFSYVIFAISGVLLLVSNFTKKEDIKKENIFLQYKINSMLDSCNIYEAKIYDNAILFKHKKDKYQYLVSKEIRPYAAFELLKSNPKYDYLISSFIKCPKDNSGLVYIYDNQGIVSVILKLKNSSDERVEELKCYLRRFREYKN
jgi:hypothetical protein